MVLDKLEMALASEPEEIKQEKELFSRLYVTSYTLEKARAYARLAKDRQGEFTECYGFLLGDTNRRSRLANDAYFTPGQKVNAAHVLIPAKKVIEAGRYIRKHHQDKRIVGWWHSHANFGTFHSGTDDENLKTVTNQIAPTNYLNIYEEKDFFNSEIRATRNNGSFYICDKHNNSRRIEITLQDLDGNPLKGIVISRAKVRMPVEVGYAYSMVVNALGDKPYGEIASRTLCTACGDGEYKSKKMPVEVIDVGDYELDIDEMKKEVKEKIILPRPFIYVPKNIPKTKFSQRFSSFFFESKDDEKEEYEEENRSLKYIPVNKLVEERKGKIIGSSKENGGNRK